MGTNLWLSMCVCVFAEKVNSEGKISKSPRLGLQTEEKVCWTPGFISVCSMTMDAG